MYNQKTIITSELYAITLKQFLSVVASVGISYLILNNIQPYTNYILIAFVIIFELSFFIKVKPIKITPLNFDDYVGIKKNTLTKESYDKFIRYHIAEMQSRIVYRKTLGLPENEYLNQMVQLLENTQTESKPQ